MIGEARNRIAADYVAAFARDGSRAYIGNLDTSVGLRDWGGNALPITVNHGEPGETFVCSPRIGYIEYPIEELAHFPNRAIVPPLRGLIRGVGAILSLCDVDRIVHINNWMMSTNLPVRLDPLLVRSQTVSLVADYPAHLLAMRSLSRRHSAELMDSLEAAGWALLPSRQVFLIDDVARDSLPRRDTRRDDALWQRGDFAFEELDEISAADADRIVGLYDMLYLEKYSRLNPAYTARFVALTHDIGMIRYLVLRDRDGVIQAFGGMHRSGEHATMPLLGYNTGMDRALGLYRLAFHAGTLFAARHKLLFNMSSGATAFKRNRGARAEMEFTAFHLRHLPRSRRYPFEFLRMVARHVGMPMLRKYQL
jgi:hypothetical protein